MKQARETQMETGELHVIFGTGPLGAWTARALLELGQRVRMVNRSGKPSVALDGVEVVKGDAYNSASTTALTAGAAAVYQCAQPAYHQWEGNFPRIQQTILAGAAANQARLIAAENLYMYGDPRGQPLTESTPYAPHTRKGRVRQAMTEALFAAHRSGVVRAASARASDFFGPYDRISAELLFQPALAGKTVNMLGRLDQPHTFSYIPDFGRVLAILGTHDEALGRAWHVPSPAPVTQSELAALIGDAIGRPVRARGSGAATLRLIGLFNPAVAELVEMLYEWTQPFVMDSSAFTERFGMQPTPLPEAIRATVAWNRDSVAHAAPLRAS
jgi:nucleoside-diphosphate-sugar epimerase